MNYFGYPLSNRFRSHVPSGFYHPVKGHTGIDILMPEGTTLSLPIQTTVASIKNQTQMGLTLYLRDQEGRILVFAHLSKVEVNEGQSVNPGETLAYSGNSGTATTAPHLHFEVIGQEPDENLEVMTRSLGEFTGYNLDPAAYLDRIFAPHWSDGAMQWALEHQIITKDHDPNMTVTWGEYVVTMQRLAERMIKWTNQN